MGVDVTITQRDIAKLLRATDTRRFILNTTESSPEADAIKINFFELSGETCSSDFGKVKNMKTDFKLLFKILIGRMIPREDNSNQISWDHRHFIFYLVNKYNINLPAYIFHNLCEAIKESKKHIKNNVPYAKLMSELFHQGCLIDALKTVSDNEDLQDIHGNILYALVQENMKILKKSDVVLSKYPLRI